MTRLNLACAALVHIVVIVTFALLELLLFPAPAGAQTYKILHLFGDWIVRNDGRDPSSGLTQGIDGNFYGATFYGGSTLGQGSLNLGYGTVFKVSPTGTVTILHSFRDGSVANDGQYPDARLAQGTDDGAFYGTTDDGGSAEYGTVFKVTPTGTVTILHSFNDGSVASDGQSPGGLVQGIDGNFYGTTDFGGSVMTTEGVGYTGLGTVFEITPKGAITILHSFGDGSVANDGAIPSGLAQGADGNFYGTTEVGGSSDNNGTVFKITPSGIVTILHSFTDGIVPDDGSEPYGSLVQGPDGNFFGTTNRGGSTSNQSGGYGTVYKITSTGILTILHSFLDGSVNDDGTRPFTGLVLGTDGNFYGTTEGGGAAGKGTVFKITPTGSVTILHSFSDGSIANDGQNPVTGLVQGVDGNFYGTTFAGGLGVGQGFPGEGWGTAYKLIVGPDEMSFFSGLQLISIPYDYSGTSLDTLFGYSGVTLATWSPVTDQYEVTPNPPADQILPGRAYWVDIPQDLTLTSIGMPANAGKAFAISLSKGWNMIGDPFLATVPLSRLMFTVRGRLQTFEQATHGASPAISPIVWGYSQLTQSYYPATSLVPGQGYLILANEAATMAVPHP